MYYNRKISDSFSKLIENNGELRWLFGFVKNHDELDFLIGKNNSTEWISVYRGLSRIITIHPYKSNSEEIKIDGAKKYKSMSASLYGRKPISFHFQKELENIIKQVQENSQFNRYYTNKKEGYYQNELSRKYGILGEPDDEFVIIDKEAVIGYSDQKEKDELLDPIQEKYKKLLGEISSVDPKRYGKDLEKKAVGNELDFLASDKQGNILLIEYKHGTNASGVYLSPIQIGAYYDIFTKFLKKDLENAVLEMLMQKRKIGLINPKWPIPKSIKGIIPVLIISEYNYRSSSKTKFEEVLSFDRTKLDTRFLINLQTFNYTSTNGLEKW